MQGSVIFQKFAVESKNSVFRDPQVLGLTLFSDGCGASVARWRHQLFCFDEQAIVLLTQTGRNRQMREFFPCYEA